MVRALTLFLMAAVLTPTLAVAGTLEVVDPWARASAGPARNGAAFLTIVNSSPKPDRLLAVASDAAATAEIHTHMSDGDVMKMRQLEMVEIPAGVSVQFEPGGYHVMLLDLVQPLKEGDTFALTLMLEEAGEIEVSVPVLAVGAMAPRPHEAHAH